MTVKSVFQCRYETCAASEVCSMFLPIFAASAHKSNILIYIRKEIYKISKFKTWSLLTILKPNVLLAFTTNILELLSFVLRDHIWDLYLNNHHYTCDTKVKKSIKEMKIGWYPSLKCVLRWNSSPSQMNLMGEVIIPHKRCS